MKSALKRTLLMLVVATVGVLCLAVDLNAQQVKHVSHAQAVSAAISKTAPVYPSTARQLRLEGMVEVQAYIKEDGSVERVENVSGNPVLLRAAQDAVKRWKFTPFKEDGKAVKAVASMNFTFKQ